MSNDDLAPVVRGVPTPLPGMCPNCFSPMAAFPCPACSYSASAAPRFGPHLAPGAALHQRYRVGRLLGQGGFGATYLGWDERLEVKVALKEFFPASLVSRGPDGRTLVPYTGDHAQVYQRGLVKFLEEARMLAKLRNIPEIVAVQDYFEENASAYLVMELLQGETLKKVVADNGGSLDYRRVLAVMMPVMKALHEIHGHGLIHRDISPDNIFLPDSGGSKLLDFGAARHAAGDGAAGLTVILKPGYAPPEQYSNAVPQGPWSDVYALAATLYCAITGRAPPESPRRMHQDTLNTPTAQGFPVPPGIETVIMTALNLKAEQRYPTVRAMLTALSKAMR